MRLYPLKLLPYLPNKTLKHQLDYIRALLENEKIDDYRINYVYKYDKIEWYKFYSLVKGEILNRQIKDKFTLDQISLLDNMFKNILRDKINKVDFNVSPFKEYHDKGYIKMCCYDLLEQHIRYHARLTEDQVKFITQLIR